jgi:hypothetical protein
MKIEFLEEVAQETLVLASIVGPLIRQTMLLMPATPREAIVSVIAQEIWTVGRVLRYKS